MKSAREKLISLLGLCSDDETEATKLQLLTKITRSADYSALLKSVALKKIYEDLYEHTKLEGLSNSDLKKRESLLHKIVSFERQLVQSIHSGNGPELTHEDLPDFTSSKSLSQLCNKIHLSHDVTNFTNISDENALSVFSDSTIKTAQKCLDMLPVSVTKSSRIDEAVIRQHMGKTLFCVNIEEFENCHRNFLRFAEKSESIIASEKLRKKKHRLLKIAIIMICFGVIFACSQFGLFSDSFTPILSLIMLIVSILFLIWG